MVQTIDLKTYLAISLLLLGNVSAAQGENVYTDVDTTSANDDLLLPESYDLRQGGFVTSVKDQSGGTCWCHATMAAIESNLLITGNWTATGEGGQPNLAEYHLDWWNGFNQHNNDDTDPPTGGGLTVHGGGDFLVAAAYITRGEGPVSCVAANDYTERDASWYQSAPAREDPSYDIYYVRDIEWLTDDADLNNIENIKNAIVTYGATATWMCTNIDFWTEDNGGTFYQPPFDQGTPDHAVAIVGWDDNKVTQAPQSGAWLIKNSSGSNWNGDGHFWISYYDKYCGQSPMGAVSFQGVELNPYDNIYYHDYHGWCATISDCNAVFNAFSARATEKIVAVSFYTSTDNVAYTVKIYDSFEAGELLEELSTKSGFLNHTGFHTVDLDKSVVVTKGDDFYVYLKLSSGGHAHDCTTEISILLSGPSTIAGSRTLPIQESSPIGPKSISIFDYRRFGKTNLESGSGILVNSVSHPGQSYYFSDSTWQDLYEFDNTANFCIKALAVDMTMVLIPGGEFQMGDHHDGMSDALPVHAVYVDSFYMSRYKITSQQYCDYLNSAISKGLIEVRSGIVYAAPGGTDPYCNTHSYTAQSQIDYSGGVFSVRTNDGIDMSDHPVFHVSWYGAVAYCNYYGHRLPTEAEWEYAARGGEHDPYYRYPWGNSIDGSKANYSASGDPYETGAKPWTTPVGYYDRGQIPAGTDMANGYGLYDMAGNVWEWCNDWYGENYYSVSPYDNPEGPASGTYRVLRGGQWNSGAVSCRAASRDGYKPPNYRCYCRGFRVVLDLD